MKKKSKSKKANIISIDPLVMSKIQEAVSMMIKSMDEDITRSFQQAIDSLEIWDIIETPLVIMNRSAEKYMQAYKEHIIDKLPKTQRENLERIVSVRYVEIVYKKRFLILLKQIPEMFTISNELKANLYEASYGVSELSREEEANKVDAIINTLPQKIKEIDEQLLSQMRDSVLDDFNSKKLSSKGMERILREITNNSFQGE